MITLEHDQALQGAVARQVGRGLAPLSELAQATRSLRVKEGGNSAVANGQVASGSGGDRWSDEDFPDSVGPVGKSGEIFLYSRGRPARRASSSSRASSSRKRRPRIGFGAARDLFFDPPRSSGVPVGLEPLAGRDDVRQVGGCDGVVGVVISERHALDSIVAAGGGRSGRTARRSNHRTGKTRFDPDIDIVATRSVENDV